MILNFEINVILNFEINVLFIYFGFFFFMQKHNADVIVVGAGMAGLACASSLKKAGLHVIVLEASFHMGGRIRTVRESELDKAKVSVGFWIGRRRGQGVRA